MADPILARQVEAMAFMLVGLGVVGLALYLRLRIFIGTRPGGVDTWYYPASAEALRAQKRPPISLPHDEKESYPPVFRLFLALLPRDFAALAYFYRVMGRRETKHTAQTPPDLAEPAPSYVACMAGLLEALRWELGLGDRPLSGVNRPERDNGRRSRGARRPRASGTALARAI